MVPGFHSKLTIPAGFCVKLKGEKSEKGSIRKGKDTWDVEIGRSKKGIIVWFDKGWEEFVQNYNLRVGDFAVFEHLGNMNFSVILLDSTGCDKKKLESAQQQVPEKEKKVKSPAQSGIEKRKFEGDQPHYQCMKGSEFMARIKEYNVRKRSPYMHIPTEFCQSNALFQNTTIMLTGPSGKSCPVSLRICNGGKTLYACITKGWHDFFSSNKLKVGDVCIFQLDRAKSDSNSIAIDVRVV